MNQKLLGLLLIAAFLNALTWILIVPIWQYPDEQAHFAQVQDIAEQGFVPQGGNDASLEIALSESLLGTARDSMGNNDFTYNPEHKIAYSDSFTGPHELSIASLSKEQRTNFIKDEATLNPPLYYLFSATIYKFFYDSNLFDRVYSIRLFSLLLYLGTIIVAYKTGVLIFNNDKILPILLSCLVAFHPMFAFSSTGILTDSMTNLLFSLVIFINLKILLGGLKFKELVLLGLVIILGFLTRQQFLIAIPISIFPLAYHTFKNYGLLRLILPLFILLLILIYVVSFLMPSLSFVRSLKLPEIDNVNLKSIFSSAFIDHFIWFIKQSYAQTLPWYWGIYKWLSLSLHPLAYQIVNRITLIALAGIMLKVYLIAKNRKFIKLDLSLTFIIFSIVMYFLIFLIWDYFHKQNYGFTFGIQGRYYFPLIIAQMAVLLIGAKQLSDILSQRYSKYLLPLLAVLMIVFNFYSLFYLTNHYYDTSSINIFVNQVSQYKPTIFKGNALIFITGALLTSFLFVATLIKKVKREKG